MSRVSNYIQPGDIGANPAYLNELRAMEVDDVGLDTWVYPIAETQPAVAAASRGLESLVARLYGCATCGEDALDASELFV